MSLLDLATQSAPMQPTVEDAKSVQPGHKTTGHLFELPPELLDAILELMTYDQISNLRPVCRHFNVVCSRLLNRGFIKAEKYHKTCLKNVKALLPRRESERRNHPLSRHCDVLSAVETRLSLLSMTYVKYIDASICCFIPGKVLDELFRVLDVISSLGVSANACPKFPKVHELLQELRDISSMAMEHFEERIVPNLKSRLNSQCILPTSQMSSAMATATKLTMRPNHVPLSNSYRLIYSTIPKGVDASSGCSSKSLTSLEEFSNLNRSLSQLLDSQKKEMHQIKHKLRISEERGREMEKEMVRLRTQMTELVDRVNSLAPSETFTSPNCSSSTSPIDSTLNAINESQKCALNVDTATGSFADGPASRTRSSSKRPASSKQANVLRKHLRSH